MGHNNISGEMGYSYPLPKALVKSTGEILNVKNKYVKYSMEVSFPDGMSDNIKKIIDDYQIEYNIDYEFPESSHGSQGLVGIGGRIIESDKTYYRLENGKSYKESELIIGMDNIRESKLNNLL